MYGIYGYISEEGFIHIIKTADKDTEVEKDANGTSQAVAFTLEKHIKKCYFTLLNGMTD